MAKTVGSGAYTYEVLEDWQQLPEGWRAPMSSVTVDSQGRVYGFCRGEHPVIVFDRDGRFLGSWGEGLFAMPHDIHADHQDNIWIIDRDYSQIFKFTPEGRLLMTIGERGRYSDTGVGPGIQSTGYKHVKQPGGPFNLPTGLDVSESGEIFIADGYANCQVHRFSADGRHLASWGQPGSGPGEFVLPHDVWLDSRGRVLVADRENDRIQLFTQAGEFIGIWPTPLIGVAAIWVDAQGYVYVPEHNSGQFSVLNLDGERLARWGSPKCRSCHDVSGDAEGNVYFVQPLDNEGSKGRRIVKYARTGS